MKRFKRKSKYDFGDYNRNRILRPYGWVEYKTTYSTDDKAIIPVVIKHRERNKAKQTIKQELNDYEKS